MEVFLLETLCDYRRKVGNGVYTDMFKAKCDFTVNKSNQLRYDRIHMKPAVSESNSERIYIVFIYISVSNQKPVRCRT